MSKVQFKQKIAIGHIVLSKEDHRNPFAGTVVDIMNKGSEIKIRGRELRMVDGKIVPNSIETERVVPEYSIEQIEDRYVIKRLAGVHPRLAVMVEVATKQQVEERNQVEVLWEALKYTAVQAHNTHYKVCGIHMRNIRAAADELQREGAFHELSQMSEALMKMAAETANVDRNKEFDGFMARDLEMRNKLVRMDHDTLKKLLNAEGMKELFGEENKHG